MMEAISSSETSVLTELQKMAFIVTAVKALKSYIALNGCAL
jgi:hypothetical protein